MMSFTQLVVAGATVALLAPSAAQACRGGPFITPEALVFLGVVATVTLPIWIVPAAVYGIAVGVSSGVKGIKDATTPALYRTSLSNVNRKVDAKEETEAIRPFFEEAEKNPTPLNLLRLGTFFHVIGHDYIASRRFVRRAIDMIKKQNPDSWDTTDPKNLVLLALAFQQLGDIQLKMQIFNEAYDYYVECKRILDNLSKISQDEKQKISLQEQQQQIGSHEPNSPSLKNTETFNILSEETASHNIGFTLLHKALYVMPHESAERQQQVSAVEMATEMLKKSRRVSDDYELDYIISEFYNFTQHFEDTRPSGVDAVDYCAKEAIHEWNAEFVPKFVAEFKEKIFPLFDHFVAKIKPPEDEASQYLWLPAAHYLARCHYVVGGSENIELARNLINKIQSIVSATPHTYPGLTFDLHFTDVWQQMCEERPELAIEYRFERINSVCVPLPLVQLNAPGSSCAVTHEFGPYTCTRPTFCSKCTKFISWEENQAGVFRCRHCLQFIVHQKCKEELGNDSFCPVATNKEEMENHKHVMRKRTLHSPHFCSFCCTFIKNPFGAFSCETCTAFFVHESCLAKMNNVLVAK